MKFARVTLFFGQLDIPAGQGMKDLTQAPGAVSVVR